MLFYLRSSILDLSKTALYDFWYDYLKPKYGGNAKLCYMDKDKFIVPVKTEDIYKYISEDVETGFNTSNFEWERPFLKGKNKKVIGLMKDELSWQIIKEFVGLRAETYHYLKDNNDEDKKQKTQKSVSSKENVNFKIIKTA